MACTTLLGCFPRLRVLKLREYEQLAQTGELGVLAGAYPFWAWWWRWRRWWLKRPRCEGETSVGVLGLEESSLSIPFISTLASITSSSVTALFSSAHTPKRPSPVITPVCSIPE